MNNKELEELKKELEELKNKIEKLEKQKNKRWRAEKGTTYYFIDDCGNIVPAVEVEMKDDNFRCFTKNYFKTKEEAQKHLDKINTYYELMDLAEEIKQKDKEIENLQKELNEENKRCMFEEQVIDLMAECIEWIGKSNGMPLDREHGENYTKKDIKEYFERRLRD